MFEKEARLAGFLFISIVYICLFLLMVNAPRISVMQTLHILIILDSGSCLLPLLSSIACTDIWGELGLHCLPPGRFLNLFYHLGTSFLCITYVICNQSDFCHSTDPTWIVHQPLFFVECLLTSAFSYQWQDVTTAESGRSEQQRGREMDE